MQLVHLLARIAWELELVHALLADLDITSSIIFAIPPVPPPTTVMLMYVIPA